MDRGVKDTIARKDSVKLDGITESCNSFSSNGSGETTASDMMKCLNALRIQDVSVTNSTPTPSAASVPRLAPPPLLTKSSVQSNPAETIQEWSDLQTGNAVTVHNRGIDGKDELVRRSSETTQGPQQWVAFSSEDTEETKSPAPQAPSKSVSVHASSSGTESSVFAKHTSSVTESPPSDEKKTTENNIAFASTESTTWNAFEECAFPSTQDPGTLAESSPLDCPSQMDTVIEDSVPQGERVLHRPMRPPPKPPIMRHQKTGSSTRSTDHVEEDMKVDERSPWLDSDDDAISLPQVTTPNDNPFATVGLQKRKSSSCSLASKCGDVLFQHVLAKHGTPQLELVETVNACFSGNKLTKYSVWGEVKFKLSGSAALSTESVRPLSPRAFECLEMYHLVLRLKCVLQHVFLKHVIAKKALMEWSEEYHRISRQSSLTMNEARKGLVESKVMHWNLARCYQEALSASVTLLRYPVQPNTLAGPPLKLQIQWQRPKKAGQPVLVDVSLIPNRRLSTSIWGVAVCLKGFGAFTARVEALACPEARWNAFDCTFEWSIPIINPDDAIQHLRVKVTEKSDVPPSEYPLSASVRFVMPHATLSGTVLLGWLERKDASPTEPLFGDETERQEPELIFCEKMCLSGNYEADINYGSK